MSVAGTENVGWRWDSAAENSEKEDILLEEEPQENKRLTASLRWQSRAMNMTAMEEKTCDLRNLPATLAEPQSTCLFTTKSNDVDDGRPFSVVDGVKGPHISSLPP